MTIQNPALRSLAEDCARAALPKWEKKGVRVANHPVWLDGQEMEWLSIFSRTGGIKVFQHFPVTREIADLSPREVRALANRRKSGISAGAIRSHFRAETRRRA